MSCQQRADGVGKKAARRSGIAGGGSQSAYTAGSTAQVSFFATRSKPTRKQRPKKANAGKSKNDAEKKPAQTSFFEGDRPDRAAETIPTQRQLKLSGHFSAEELDALSVQLMLGLSAVSRRVREAESGFSRGLTHSDPRPLDWAKLDQEQFQLLVKRLAQARRREGNDCLDMSGLADNQLGELWAFVKFETERANRNIEQLAVPGGPIGGPTADYLSQKLRLEARFYTLLAMQLEKIKPVEALAEAAGLSAVGLD